MRRYIPGNEQGNPEKIWVGLEWADLDDLPVRKNERIVKVYYALWVYPEGYIVSQD